MIVMRYKKCHIVLFICLISTVQVVASSPMLTQALDLYNHSKFEEARREFRLAVIKDKEAFYFLGRMFALGEGVEVNYDSAGYYYRKGISSGDLKNNYGMFFLYARGGGDFAKDEKKAASALAVCYAEIVASARTSAFWKSILGVMHYWGYHVPQSFDKAFVYYSEAAQQGWSMGQFNLGVMYERGEATKQDYVQAAKWYARAAALEFPDASYNLGLMHEKGEFIPLDEAKALQLYESAAMKKHTGAQIQLAGLYKYGAGTAPDVEKATYWYEQAAAAGDEDADSNLHALKGFKNLKYFRLIRWEKALEQARKEKKLIFVDFYTTWCGPCRWMEKNVFALPEVEKIMGDRFICLRINIEQEETALVEKLTIESIPTLVFFDADGNVLHRGSGALPSEELIPLAEQVLSSAPAVDKSK
jgi:TPR repeat protein